MNITKPVTKDIMKVIDVVFVESQGYVKEQNVLFFAF